MKIHRAGPPDGFTQIPNAALRDRRLSWKARGLLAYLLSHIDDGWAVDARRLAKEGPDGRIAILAGLNELVEAGYIVRTKHRTKEGRLITEMDVWDTPQPVTTQDAEPGSENLTPAYPQDNSYPQEDPEDDQESYPQTAGRTGSRLTDAGSPDAGKPDPYRRPPENTIKENHQDPGGTLPPDPLRDDPPTSDRNENPNSILSDINQQRDQHGNLRPHARAIGRATVPEHTAKIIPFPPTG